MTNIKSEARFRLIKIMDIGYMVILYVIFGIFLSKITDALFGEYTEDETKAKSTLRLIIEIIIIVWFTIIVFYVARNIMEVVPSPFDGLYGYDHSRLKEVTNGLILAFTYIYFQNELRNKLGELNRRLSLNRDF